MEELRVLLRLALPITLVQVGLRAMSTVDTMMVGHFSGDAMAAVAVGNSWVWFVTIFCMGFLMATDPLFSQAVGAGDDAAISRTMQRGLVWAAALTVPATVAIWQVDAVLELTSQPAHVARDAVRYARIASFGTLPVLVFGVLRHALQAHTQLRALLVTIVVANLFNAAANRVLVFGELGLPALGAVGTAWATLASRWLMALMLLAGGWSRFGRHVLSFGDAATRARALALRPLGRIAVLGAPIGLQIALELGVFAATTLTIGSLGGTDVAGHQITLDLSSITFMVAVGVGVAGSVRVGHAVGRGDTAGARRAGVTALGLITAVMAGFAALFVLVPSGLASLYSNEAPVVAVAALLIPIAALFQVFDGLQAVAVGVLRGLGDTRTPLYVTIVGFWLLGFPSGLWFCFGLDLGAAGMWWGLVVGLGCVAAALLAIVRVRLRREQRRIALD